MTPGEAVTVVPEVVFKPVEGDQVYDPFPPLALSVTLPPTQILSVEEESKVNEFEIFNQQNLLIELLNS